VQARYARYIERGRKNIGKREIKGLALYEQIWLNCKTEKHFKTDHE
jgi:hypothetical protein